MKLRKDVMLAHFQAMIRIRTVSGTGTAEEDAAFETFRRLLKECYPVVMERGEAWKIGERAVLIRIPGRSQERPSVLMAHMDVVPADEEAWSCDPFGGEIRDGRVYGRGTLDTKCTLCSIMEAAEYQLSNGFVPRQDLYLSFGGEEEISGEACPQIVAFLKERGVHPDFVLDEGGAVIPEGLPGVRKQAAMIGIAEKGRANYMISLHCPRSGHASVPPRHTVAGRLARAAVEIESHPFPARLSTPIRKMFRELAPWVPLPERPLFRHPELASPGIRLLASALGGSFNAMVRSTAAVVILEARSAFNVLPDRAAMGVNVRLLEGDTVDSAAAFLRRIISDPEVRVDLIDGCDPTPVSDTDCPAYANLCSVIRRTWRDTLVAPYQMNGGTDARYFEEIADHIYRFTPMVMTAKERESVHGRDESIAIGTLYKMAAFYIRLIGTL